MSIETRKRLIDHIIQAYYSNDRETLKVSRIAELAGITRQALHRYYDDLIPYIKGDRNVAELLSGQEQTSVAALLVAAQQRVAALETELSNIQNHHDKELEKRINSYITSLMKNDVSLFETDEITKGLQKQTALITEYTEQITELKVKLAKVALSSTDLATDKINGSRLILEPKLHKALAEYKKEKNYDEYLNRKDKEINKIIDKINMFKGDDIRLIIFLDTYVCDFSQFFNSLPSPTQNEIVVRLPIYTTFELKYFFKKIATPGFRSIFIPEHLSHAESAAQRKFRSHSIPEEELALASKAEKVYLFKGVNEVVHHLITSNS